ncbi:MULTISPECIES: rod shape-determining protein MreD [unclassified Novosphingobium]|uniref:rod shape-determining protein MreD n=1 Tax=unclassified Novosphingobium TaxID=2644732 RepID=UPI0025FE6617|nr:MULTISPECIES: rod shape-determining protein MreD [unclassified Novosphingobium]HQV02809.1 rod shape-determining protein MreD [Novosphingobium sp.]
MPLPLAEPLTDTLRDFGKPRINRAPSPTLAIALPWLLVMLGSLSPVFPIVSSAALVPPFGFILLVAWQQLRPGLFPVWAGLPLGLFDDLYSGQPFGSAVLLWSASMIALDLLEVRFPWRGVELNWLAASGIVTLYIVLAAQLADLAGGNSSLLHMLPQIVLSILVYPIAARLVGAFDRFRLIPIRKF